jgi:hypothetical protein
MGTSSSAIGRVRQPRAWVHYFPELLFLRPRNGLPGSAARIDTLTRSRASFWQTAVRHRVRQDAG